MMQQLQRIQLKRTKGWRMPENTAKVDRSTKWGNWYSEGTYPPGTCGTLGDLPLTVEQSVRYFRADLEGRYIFKDRRASAAEFDEWIKPLRGKNLACWCALDQPCHGDVLLKIANRGEAP